ncbi:hypothetical protein ElyMa_004371400 [Elysia marginata]|uniref:EGF-like domain-containing protein n=1 Tax=Elysia marginata TaxID=1093978 RepID=A0AAV4H5S6_9GAST|nr:hypothetical protein ElyMa_004371400 [Elysia marginata]
MQLTASLTCATILLVSSFQLLHGAHSADLATYNCCLMRVSGCNITADTGACECSGFFAHVSCQWQRVKQAVLLLPWLTHLQTAHQVSTVKSLRSLEIEVDRNGTTRAKPAAQDRSDAELVGRKNDTWPAKMLKNHFDPQGEITKRLNPQPQMTTEHDLPLRVSSQRILENGNSTMIQGHRTPTFRAVQKCCLGKDYMAVALGCDVQDGLCLCPSAHHSKLLHCVPLNSTTRSRRAVLEDTTDDETEGAGQVQKREASKFRALQKCCDGTDPVAVTLGCILQGQSG